MNHRRATVIQPQPLVSIITPAYNTEKYIAEAIESVINQTWQNWELLLINDGSTDRTKEICQQYAERDSRIRLTNTENHGVSAARNIGLKQIKGEYVTFLDSDDVLPINSIASRTNALISHDVDIVGGKIILFTENLKTALREFESDYNGEFLEPLCRMDEGVFFAVFYIVKAKVIHDVSFDIDMRNYEDLMFWIRCCSKTNLKYKGICEESYYYRYRNNSASNNINNWRKGQKQVLRKTLKIKVKIKYKAILGAIIMRQMLSYYVKRFFGVKIRQFKGID